MKIAVIGKGKTGSEVIDMLDESQITGIYSNSVRPTVSDLRQAEVAIVFVPGTAIMSLIPILLAARIPVICGATNVAWPENFAEQVKSNEVVWVNSRHSRAGGNPSKWIPACAGMTDFHPICVIN